MPWESRDNLLYCVWRFTGAALAFAGVESDWARRSRRSSFWASRAASCFGVTAEDFFAFFDFCRLFGSLGAGRGVCVAAAFAGGRGGVLLAAGAGSGARNFAPGFGGAFFPAAPFGAGVFAGALAGPTGLCAVLMFRAGCRLLYRYVYSQGTSQWEYRGAAAVECEGVQDAATRTNGGQQQQGKG